MLHKRIILISILFIAILAGCLLYFRHQVYFSHGRSGGEEIFEIDKGEGNVDIASRLADHGLVSNRFYFYYYLRTHGFLNRIIPGDYKLSGNMTIPEIASAIADPKESFIKVTFPEGLTISEMGEILEKNGFSKGEFLKSAGDPSIFKEKYPFLRDENIKTLEGYLFPDTYFFKAENTSGQIISKILDNYEVKISARMEADVLSQGKTMYEIMTMASIVEKEVSSSADMKKVAGVFWNRLSIDMPLQSDATLSYILDDNIDQHSIDQLKTDSPYNTYKYRGLPPGPIANPGIGAINAASYPDKTDYAYFLTVGPDGSKETIFSKTFEEHVANRKKYGL